jgi:hypothetical protein
MSRPGATFAEPVVAGKRSDLTSNRQPAKDPATVDVGQQRRFCDGCATSALPPMADEPLHRSGTTLRANKRLLHRSKRPLGSITQPAAILAGARSHASPTGIAYR